MYLILKALIIIASPIIVILSALLAADVATRMGIHEAIGMLASFVLSVAIINFAWNTVDAKQKSVKMGKNFEGVDDRRIPVYFHAFNPWYEPDDSDLHWLVNSDTDLLITRSMLDKDLIQKVSGHKTSKMIKREGGGFESIPKHMVTSIYAEALTDEQIEESRDRVGEAIGGLIGKAVGYKETNYHPASYIHFIISDGNTESNISYMVPIQVSGSDLKRQLKLLQNECGGVEGFKQKLAELGGEEAWPAVFNLFSGVSGDSDELDITDVSDFGPVMSLFSEVDARAGQLMAEILTLRIHATFS